VSTPAGYHAILTEFTLLPDREKLPETLKNKGLKNRVKINFPEFPGIISSASSLSVAPKKAYETLNNYLMCEYDRDTPLPEYVDHISAENKKQRVIFVRLRSDVRYAYLLREVRKGASKSQSSMSKLLGIKTQTYQKMERPGCTNLEINTLERIAEVCGMELNINFIRKEEDLSDHVTHRHARITHAQLASQHNCKPPQGKYANK